MTKHLADHRNSSGSQRLKQFLRIARDRSETAFHTVWQRQNIAAGQSRRVVEFTRIARGRSI
jgi:hypothetical protein